MTRRTKVVIELDENEARSLEYMLDDTLRHLKKRTAVMHSMAADQLIDRYRAISEKVRKARNPLSPARELAHSTRKAEVQ